MKSKNHAILILIVFCAWLTFYLIGIPSNYFQDWSTAEQVLLSLITVFAGVPLITFLALIIIGENYFKTSVWLAFYASVPLAIIDFIVCGIIQKGGFNFFISHWYVTLGYFYVWIICPLVGYLLNRFKKQMQNM